MLKKIIPLMLIIMGWLVVKDWPISGGVILGLGSGLILLEVFQLAQVTGLKNNFNLKKRWPNYDSEI